MVAPFATKTAKTAAELEEEKCKSVGFGASEEDLARDAAAIEAKRAAEAAAAAERARIEKEQNPSYVPPALDILANISFDAPATFTMPAPMSPPQSTMLAMDELAAQARLRFNEAIDASAATPEAKATAKDALASKPDALILETYHYAMKDIAV